MSLPTDTAEYTLSLNTITIAKGSTTGTATLTPVDDSATDGDETVTLSDSTATPSALVTVASTATITIQEDDIHPVPGITATAAKQSDNTYDITVLWGAANTENTRNADGYDIRHSTDGSTWTEVAVTPNAITTVTDDIEGVTTSTTYRIQVRAKKSSPAATGPWSSSVMVGVGEDFDADDDGYIDVGDLAQLNAIRWDLDANGAPSSGNESTYWGASGAFTNAIPGMGCPSAGCVGYEIRASLDFDTDGDGTADSGDTYWNSGNGWLPIGGASGSQYTGEFDGNADTDTSGDGGPYTISNLFIDRTAGRYAGLFAYIYSGNKSIEDVALENVDVTLNVTANDNVYVGGLAGRIGGGSEIEDSYTTGRVRAGESASEPVTFSAASKDAYVGGLVGEANTSPISTSYSLADVTSHVTSTQSSPTVKAGGLAGVIVGTSSNNSYVVAASYAAGDVVASAVGTTLPGAYAGGLIGDDNSTNGIKASYARGDVSATNSSSGALTAGGLVGLLSGNIITGSYATGAVTTTGTATLGAAGGLVGFSSGSAVNSYWDTESSGNSTSAVGTGQTTSALQTPTAYGTGTDIYANWNLDFDGTTGNDDPWDFGTANQYPTLKYGSHTAGDQRAVVTLSASPTTIWERALTSPSRVNASTITATLDTAWNEDVVVTLPTNAAYTTSATTITISAGSTTGTATLTAVNNLVDAANATVTLTQATHPAATKWVSKGTDVSITINDDDELAKPTGLKLSVDGTKIRADWAQVPNATGYKVQWSTANTTTGWASPGEGTVSSGSTTNYTINPTPALTASTLYYVRVLPTKSGADEPPSDVASTTTVANSGDYDDDNDGLIEITTLAQLNAIRWDLNGDGQVASGDQTNYDAAFPNAEDNMGCSESIATISSNNTGNPACTGYELGADLDFDTGTAGDRTDDTYYNSGQGWLPIGATAGSTTASAYTGDFDGGTAYKISNLQVNRSSTTTVAHGGLFAELGSGASVKNLRLEGVSVVVATDTSATTGADVYAGGIAGKSAGSITGSYVVGTVKATQSDIPSNTTEGDAFAGGLVGHSTGAVLSSYARATVTAEQLSDTDNTEAQAGGLVGYQDTGGSVSAAYTRGSATAVIKAANGGQGHAGGLVGYLKAGDVTSSYSAASAKVEVPSGSSPATLTMNAGGLVGTQDGGGITASYATGAPSLVKRTAASPTENLGGITGRYASGTTTNSYWDSTTSGITATGQGTAKTTSELQTPTAYGTGSSIYANWNQNLDGQSGNDDPWNFGTASQYPVLKYNLTIPPQRASVTLSLSPATIYESNVGGSTRDTTSTVTATLSGAWHNDVTVTPLVDASYTLSAATITITAGSTSGTTTLTAVNNYLCGTATCPASASNKSVSVTSTSNDPWVSVGTAPSLTITDDDAMAAATGLKLAVDGVKIQVDWTAVTGATGYRVEWNTANSGWSSIPSTQKSDVSGGSTVTYTISPTPALSANTTYYVRVLPTKSGADEPPSAVVSTTTRASGGTGDYDDDNDGLIEITTLAQLNAVRYDLDGDGQVDSATNQTAYDTAFPNAEDNMGCSEGHATISSNNTGNPACTGYELGADLDFDTGTAGDRSDDTYYNSGSGWDPIGGVAGTAYTGKFDGNTYTISNLHIDRSTGNYAGLFAYLNGASGTTIENVTLVDVDVTFSSHDLHQRGLRLHGRAGGTRRQQRNDRGQLHDRAGAGRRVGHGAGNHQRQRQGTPTLAGWSASRTATCCRATPRRTLRPTPRAPRLAGWVRPAVSWDISRRAAASPPPTRAARCSPTLRW